MTVPILDLQRRLRELGRIRMGTRGSKGEPRKLTTWRLTSPSEPLMDVVAELYGGEVKPWTSPAGQQYECITATDVLDAIVPPGQTLSSWYEMWTGGGCQRRCDGEHEQISDSPCLCPEDDDERRKLAAKGQACRITTRLGIILPRIPDVGLWRLDTSGYYAATELAGAYDICSMATTQGRMVPVRLRLEQRMAKRQGGTLRYAVPVLELGVTFGELVAAVGSDALVGTGEGLALPEDRPSRPALGDGAFTQSSGSSDGVDNGPLVGKQRVRSQTSGDSEPYPTPCPQCGSQARQEHQWKPDLNPTRERHRCYDCGYDSGWVETSEADPGDPAGPGDHETGDPVASEDPSGTVGESADSSAAGIPSSEPERIPGSEEADGDVPGPDKPLEVPGGENPDDVPAQDVTVREPSEAQRATQRERAVKLYGDGLKGRSALRRKWGEMHPNQPTPVLDDIPYADLIALIEAKVR